MPVLESITLATVVSAAATSEVAIASSSAALATEKTAEAVLLAEKAGIASQSSEAAAMKAVESSEYAAFKNSAWPRVGKPLTNPYQGEGVPTSRSTETSW